MLAPVTGPLLLSRPVLPGTSAHIVGLLFAVSWGYDDGHARSLRSLRIA